MVCWAMGMEKTLFGSTPSPAISNWPCSSAAPLRRELCPRTRTSTTPSLVAWTARTCLSGAPSPKTSARIWWRGLSIFRRVGRPKKQERPSRLLPNRKSPRSASRLAGRCLPVCNAGSATECRGWPMVRRPLRSRTDAVNHYCFLWCLAVQADGKILVGGYFTALGGQPRSYIGRLNSSGTLDTGFDPGASSTVYSLAVQTDGKIVVGGAFGRLNVDGTRDTGFTPAANGAVENVLFQPDGKIVVAGTFTSLGGQPRHNIGRLNSDGTVDLGFNPGTDYLVSSLALQADGRIVIGGVFTTLGGQPRSNLGRLNADGTLDPILNQGTDASFNGTVYSVAVQTDGKILVAGNFATLAGQPRSRIGRFNSTDPATQSLTCEASTITWLRGGVTPEIGRAHV